MTGLLISHEAKCEAITGGRPVWPMNSPQIFVYCPNGHLNEFPPKWEFCLCGFHFSKLIERYKIRYAAAGRR